MPRHSIVAPRASSIFQVNADFNFVKELHRSMYGSEIVAVCRTTGERCVVRKVSSINSKKVFTKRCLREIKFLHHFRGHHNIIYLYDLDIDFQLNGDFGEVYLYEELMETNLWEVMNSGQALSHAHYQSFIYQTLCGLKYIHSANVLHRDLRPTNLLLNADCNLKISGFRFARGDTSDGASKGFLTDNVATKYYRAPEIMLSSSNYSTPVDIWSVGCILAELFNGKPLFKGLHYLDQFHQILRHLGSPSQDTLRRMASPRAQDYVRSLPIETPTPLSELCPSANALGLDLLRQLLRFDPEKRFSCVQALEHPYFQEWHDPHNEPVCETKIDFSFEAADDIDGMKQHVVQEVDKFRKLVRIPTQDKDESRPSAPTHKEAMISKAPDFVPVDEAACTCIPGAWPPSPTRDV